MNKQLVLTKKKGYMLEWMRIFVMLVRELGVGAWQIYSQVHNLEVTEITSQSGGNRNLALSKFVK